MSGAKSASELKLRWSESESKTNFRHEQDVHYPGFQGQNHHDQNENARQVNRSSSHFLPNVPMSMASSSGIQSFHARLRDEYGKDLQHAAAQQIQVRAQVMKIEIGKDSIADVLLRRTDLRIVEIGARIDVLWQELSSLEDLA